MTTRVVNLRREPYDVYIGRAGHGLDGALGNPFALDPARRGDPVHVEEVLTRFARYFLGKVTHDETFRGALLAARGKRLGCFCKNAQGEGPCHGDLYAAWLDAPDGSSPEARAGAVMRAIGELVEAARRRQAGATGRGTGGAQVELPLGESGPRHRVRHAPVVSPHGKGRAQG